MKNFFKTILIMIIMISLFSSWGLSGLNLAQGMSSETYQIQADSVNMGGGLQTSASYKLENSVGEIATGQSSSASYGIKSGYQAMWDYAPFLSFSLTGNTVNFGLITPYDVSSGYTSFSAATNAQNGYVVSSNGTTLTHTNASDVIDAMPSSALSESGTEQFGLNLVANTSPSIGSDPSGGSGAGASGYNTANYFKFVSGETIASSSSFTDTTDFTVSYISNIGIDTVGGGYSTVLTFIATGTF